MGAGPASEGAGLVRGLQERAARGLQAAEVRRAGGWWLRHSPGCAWWSGTVLPHGAAGPGGLEGGVAEAERFYAARGAVARFQITPGACAEGLDAVLAGRGYGRGGGMSLQVADARRVSEGVAGGGLRVVVDGRRSRAWFAVWAAVHGPVDAGAEWAMLGRVRRPSAFARVLAGDEVVAVGRAVADGGWAGVFGMATLPRARGRGAGRGVLAALAGWAVEWSAARLYLQVERDNGAALGLYGRAGFAELCGYHYRSAGSADAPA